MIEIGFYTDAINSSDWNIDIVLNVECYSVEDAIRSLSTWANWFRLKWEWLQSRAVPNFFYQYFEAVIKIFLEDAWVFQKSQSSVWVSWEERISRLCADWGLKYMGCRDQWRWSKKCSSGVVHPKMVSEFQWSHCRPSSESGSSLHAKQSSFSTSQKSPGSRQAYSLWKTPGFDSYRIRGAGCLAKKTGLVTAVNYNLRFYPICQEAKARVAAGDLGTPYLIHGAYLQDWLFLKTDWNWRLETEQGAIYAWWQTLERIGWILSRILPGLRSLL